MTAFVKTTKRFDSFPQFLKKIVVVISGDWITIWVHFNKYMKLQKMNDENTTSLEPNAELFSKNGSLLYYIITAAIGSYTIYFGIGGFLHVRICALKLFKNQLYKQNKKKLYFQI